MDYLNATKRKLYRSKGSEQKKKNDVLRKKLWLAKLKENPMKYKQYKVNERYRKLQNKENKVFEVEEAGQCSSSPDSSFKNKQMLHRSLSRTDSHLPKSPHKKVEVIEKLVEEYHVKIPFNTKRGRPQKDLNKEENILKYHKDYCYNQNTPHGSCLCEICENYVLLAKGLNTMMMIAMVIL